ncbi:MAG: hypothetical protein M0P09_01320 [Acholeplasmataceae bacterium]|nr:hypothetical protein [Acholeplasmataceae bacterium]
MSVFPWEPGYKAPERADPDAIRKLRADAGRISAKAKRDLDREGNRKERRANKKAKTELAETQPIHGPLYYLEDENITHRQLEMIHGFIDAYLQTWSPGQAFLLSNPKYDKSITSATKAGMDLLQSPAVQRRLQAVVDSMDEEKLLTRKGVIMGLLKEANHYSGDATHGGRIRAWMGLARIKKMDIQVTESNVTVRGGVMVIPGTPDGQIIDVEAWEKSSEAQQLDLKEEVRK